MKVTIKGTIFEVHTIYKNLCILYDVKIVKSKIIKHGVKVVYELVNRKSTITELLNMLDEMEAKQ